MTIQRLLYNDNGTNVEIDNSGSLPSIYYDTASGSVNTQGVVVSSITASLSNTGIVLTDATGKLSVASTSSVQNNSYLKSDGITWRFITATDQLVGNFTAGSDVSGTFANGNVKSVENVTSGILKTINGGTGVSSFLSGGILLADGANPLKFVKPDSAGAILRPQGSTWYSGGAAGTTSPSVSGLYVTTAMSPYNWTKPAGVKNAKVILMGGGGGGCGGALGAGTGPAMLGGAAGGFSMYDLDVSNVSSATISAGTGGARGIANTTTPAATAAGDGGESYFSCSYGKFYAGGGSGGTLAPLNAGRNKPGFGNISSKGNGGYANSPSLATNPADNYFGSGGGASGVFPGHGYRPAGSGNVGRILGINVANSGSNNVVTTSVGIPGFYALFAGGGQGNTNAAGQDGQYGSGGGRGYQAGTVPTAYPGGRGGDGYVILIYW